MLVVADTTQQMPGFAGNYAGFSDPTVFGRWDYYAINETYVAYLAWGQHPQERAIYLEMFGATSNANFSPLILRPYDTRLVAKRGDPRSDGHTVDQMSRPYYGYWGEVQFRDGTGPSEAVLGENFSRIRRVVGAGDSIPGAGGQRFAHVSLIQAGQRHSWYGRNEDGTAQGIYGFDPAGTRALADLTTPIPGGTGNFTGFGEQPVAAYFRAAFRGEGSGGQEGIYLVAVDSQIPPFDTSPIKLMDRDDEPIGYPGLTIVDLGDPSGGDGIAWTAVLSDGRTVIYHHERAANGGAGTIRPLYDTTRPILGRVVASINLGPEAVTGDLLMGTQYLSGGNVGFHATFRDGSEGIYVVSAIPEPATSAVVAMAVVMWLARRPGR